MQPDRLRPLAPVPEVGLVLFLYGEDGGVTDCSFSRFIDIPYLHTILNGTPLLILIYFDISLMYWYNLIFHLSLVKDPARAKDDKYRRMLNPTINVTGMSLVSPSPCL